MTQDDGWMDFTDKYGHQPDGGGPCVRVDRYRISLPKGLYEELGKPKQVYFRYCRAPLALAIVPITRPGDIPGEGVKVYKVWQQGTSAVALWRYLGLAIKQPHRLPARVENRKLIIELESLRDQPHE